MANPSAITCRASPTDVALETTLLCHGVPRGEGRTLVERMGALIRSHGVEPAVVGIVSGRPVVGLTDAELDEMLGEPDVVKVNRANLGVVVHRGQWGATTVGTTCELAAAVGLRIMATGGIGGVHRAYGTDLDISADLATLATTPMAVVTSGCKSILDVAATREVLETLGIPVIGFCTDSFPAFYLRESPHPVDARFDDPADLSAFLAFELDRTGRGVIVAHPVPQLDAIAPDDWDRWFAAANAAVAREAPTGRDRTPALLAALHAVSDGRTLSANLSLVEANACLAARLCNAWPDQGLSGN